MTNQQGAPEALRLANALECRTTSWTDKVFAAFELRRLHYENERLAALVEAQQHARIAAAPQPTPTAQAAPAAGITVEQVEDAIGLQSAAWDTIGAEKIVEAVLRLANGQAPAAGAVAGPGWKLVPVDPTDDMLRAIRNQRSGGRIGAGDRADWAAWLAAAPTPSAQADSQPAPVLAYPPLPRVGAIGYASVVDIDSYAKTLTIGPHLPGVRDIALWTTDQMRAYADETVDAARKQGGKP